MKGKSIVALVVLLYTATLSASGGLKLGETEIVFATPEQGREILTRHDVYAQGMSPFDLSAKMKTDKEVSQADYLEFAGQNVLAWNESEEARIVSALETIRNNLESFSLPLPDTVFIIKTTGNEEGGAAYTRANAIIFPKFFPGAPIEVIQRYLAHELFHIMSRESPELRDKLYEAIGFRYCGEDVYPKELQSRKITNPDAPKTDQCIRVVVDGKERLATPIIFSSAETYDVSRGGTFFDYLEFKLLIVERHSNSSSYGPLYENGEPKLVDPQDVSGFFEQIGSNTQYLIHPEETLADNFALMITGVEDLPSPEIVQKISAILRDHKEPE